MADPRWRERRLISPLEAARAAAAADLPPRLSHTLVVLALFFPDVRPTQDQLADMLHIKRRAVNDRLRELERLGRIRRVSGATGRATSYRLMLRKAAPHSAVQTAHQEQISTATTTASDVGVEFGDDLW